MKNKKEGPDKIITHIKSLLILEKEKTEISVIKGTRILFRSEKENKMVNSQTLEHVKALFQSEEDYYQSLKTRRRWGKFADNYIKFKKKR